MIELKANITVDVKTLTAEVREAALAALRQGNKIEAIKLIREATGCDLKTAKDLSEVLERDPSCGRSPAGAGGAAVGGVPPDLVALARQGQKIQAIKALRERTGLGLREAKEAIERIPGLPPAKSGCLAVVLFLVCVALTAAGVLLARCA